METLKIDVMKDGGGQVLQDAALSVQPPFQDRSCAGGCLGGRAAAVDKRQKRYKTNILRIWQR